MNAGRCGRPVPSRWRPRTRTPRHALAKALRSLAVVVLLATAARGQPCAGDCNGDGTVSVAEIVTGVSIALGNAPLSACPVFACRSPTTVTIDCLVQAVRSLLEGCPAVPTPTPTPVPAALPPLVSSDPAAGSEGVAPTAWIDLRFDGIPDPRSFGAFQLACGNTAVPVDAVEVEPGRVLVNPFGPLPAPAQCELTWPGATGTNRLPFRTAASGAGFFAAYDRTDTRHLSPYPDDYWLVNDPSTRTGLRLDLPLPAAPSDVQGIYAALLAEANRLDGFSPIGHFVIELSALPDASTLPLTPEASLEPLATVGLFDLSDERHRGGYRVPFRVDVRDDETTAGRARSLLIFPSIPLDPRGHYALVLTRRIRSADGRLLEPSPFFAGLLDPRGPAAGPEEERARAVVDPLLTDLGEHLVLPLQRDDIALALSVHVRSDEDIPADMLEIKRQILESDPPQWTIESVTEGNSSDVAAIVRGVWSAPDWRDGPNFARDAEGRPERTGERNVPFVLALPAAARNAPVPVIMHQHGNPGSMEEVVTNARRFLAGAGFAVIGFTDILNREVAPGPGTPEERIAAQVTDIVVNLLLNHRIPDHWAETKAEQLAFVRMIGTMGDLDVLPLGAPDGVPDLDVAAPLGYHGISEGANNGQGLLAYAPEIRAAALVVGGARLVETLIHQQATTFLEQLPAFFPSVDPVDIWTGLALFQAIFDVQDNHNHLPFVYRRPLPIPGFGSRRSSVLVLEGIGDSLVPNHATESLAFALGPIPHVRPVQRPVPFLFAVPAPLRANIDAATTAGLYQYVPDGIDGIPATPGCAGEREGHFCPQTAPESRRQRADFFTSALTDPAPVIVDPLAGDSG